MIRYSVIIPVYNAEKYLGECLDSLLKVQDDLIQIILVDDGSSDKSPAICDDYASKDPRITVIHQANSGATRARKKGVEAAAGSYIVCIDADDWLEEDFFDKCDKVIDDHDPDMVCCGYKKMNEGTVIDHKFPYPAGLYDKDRIRDEFFPSLITDGNGGFFPRQLWAKVFKRELFEQYYNDVDDKLVIGEDAAAVIPVVYNAQKVYVLEDELYCYRYTPGSLTKSGKALRWDDIDLWHNEITRKIDTDLYDLKTQVYRYDSLQVFYTVVSQFNRNEPYRVIVKDIKTHMANPLYLEALRNASFDKGSKQNIKLFLARHRIGVLLKLYCKYVYNKME